MPLDSSAGLLLLRSHSGGHSVSTFNRKWRSWLKQPAADRPRWLQPFAACTRAGVCRHDVDAGKRRRRQPIGN